jgi:hypothetical protein
VPRFVVARTPPSNTRSRRSRPIFERMINRHRQIPGGFDTKIAFLTGSGNGKSHASSRLLPYAPTVLDHILPTAWAATVRMLWR